MKLQDLKISKQINIYFGAIFIIVLLLVVNSFLSVEGLWKNTAGSRGRKSRCSVNTQRHETTAS
jgi:hypothetical protein